MITCACSPLTVGVGLPGIMGGAPTGGAIVGGTWCGDREGGGGGKYLLLAGL